MEIGAEVFIRTSTAEAWVAGQVVEVSSKRGGREGSRRQESEGVPQQRRHVLPTLFRWYHSCFHLQALAACTLLFNHCFCCAALHLLEFHLRLVFPSSLQKTDKGLKLKLDSSGAEVSVAAGQVEQDVKLRNLDYSRFETGGRGGVDDLVQLQHLHEPAILDVLDIRFGKG